MKSLSKHALDVCDAKLFSEPDCPFSPFVQEGLPDVVVITGDNASGKSLAFKIMSYRLSDDNVLPVTISIRERTGGGTYENASMRRAFMFGDEGEQSTGATSVGVTLSGFNNMVRDSDKGVALLLDEPEMGLSDGYAAAFGALIAQKHIETKSLAPSHYQGLVIVSHNKALISSLVSALGANPTHISMGANSTLEEWIAFQGRKSIEELLSLKQVGRDRMRFVQDYLNNRKGK